MSLLNIHRATGTVEGMTRADGGQPRQQRTVAELLAQYGGQVDGGKRHRHRRPEEEAAEAAAESDVTTTAPQAIIERVHAEAPEVDWDTRRNGRSHAYGGQNGAAPTPAPAAPPAPPAANGKQMPPPPPAPPAGALSARLDGAPAAPPPAPRGPRWGRDAAQEPSTEQFDAYTHVDDETQFGAPNGFPAVADYPEHDDYPEADYPEASGYAGRGSYGAQEVADYPEHDYPEHDGYPAAELYTEQDEDDGYPPYVGAPHDDVAPGPREPGIDRMPRSWHDDLEPEDFDDTAHPERDPRAQDANRFGEDYERTAAEASAPEDEPSPGQQWLAVGGQLAAGVVGGAIMWLLFNWLWVRIPAVALGVALLVVVGLVWIVRKIRKAEDLQTTVLAVLVGLVVTISPAAMLLLDR